jgi:SWI/SNF-related matrix-associated actin-dependent regulator of chromatin subfamily A3
MRVLRDDIWPKLLEPHRLLFPRLQQRDLFWSSDKTICHSILTTLGGPNALKMAPTPQKANSAKMPDQSGKRKRVETVDLTADDSNDTDDLNAPVRETKRPHTTPNRQAPTPSTGRDRSSFSFSGMSVPVSSQQHSEAERQAWLDEDEDDVRETVGSTQLDAADGIDQLVHYGDLDARIVGARFYSGFASPGEVVMIRREPGNPYDSNAIRIDNINRQQIGHIPKNIAVKLAPYIDERALHCEGKLAGPMGYFDVR